jgi:hypothetical protein
LPDLKQSLLSLSVIFCSRIVISTPSSDTNRNGLIIFPYNIHNRTTKFRLNNFSTLQMVLRFGTSAINKLPLTASLIFAADTNARCLPSGLNDKFDLVFLDSQPTSTLTPLNALTIKILLNI